MRLLYSYCSSQFCSSIFCCILQKTEALNCVYRSVVAVSPRCHTIGNRQAGYSRRYCKMRKVIESLCRWFGQRLLVMVAGRSLGGRLHFKLGLDYRALIIPDLRSSCCTNFLLKCVTKNSLENIASASSICALDAAICPRASSMMPLAKRSIGASGDEPTAINACP